MKLISFKTDGKEKVGFLENEKITEINTSMIEAIKTSNVDKIDILGEYKLNDVKIDAPISPSKIVCVGLNYKDHAKELKMDLPEEPVIFIKPSTAVIGHLDTIIYPECSNQVDFESELGIVISREAHCVNYGIASDFIGGYTVLNDVTARDKQREGYSMDQSKKFRYICPDRAMY